MQSISVLKQVVHLEPRGFKGLIVINIVANRAVVNTILNLELPVEAEFAERLLASDEGLLLNEVDEFCYKGTSFDITV
jgi:hypothetical protein